jgi:hypothetical protein
MADKTCSKCGTVKCSSKFNKDASKKDGLDSKCKECKRRSYEYTDEMYLRNKRNNLKSKFNLTLEEYNCMFEEQKGCCAICNKHQSELSRSLAVDHSHSNGHVRALLCQSCNTALGKFKDSINMLNKAINYLDTYGE